MHIVCAIYDETQLLRVHTIPDIINLLLDNCTFILTAEPCQDCTTGLR